MNIIEALAWLDARLDHETSSAGIAAGRIDGLSLDGMRDLMALQGDPQDAVPVIHITGTNGKGTVAAMITSLLMAHGLSVGTYTSPHLERLNERIARDGEPIGDEDLAEVLSGIAAVEPLLEVQPSWFEVMTAAAFRWFAEAPVDVAVVEVGLLGRYDATNVADARVAVVTSIGGDPTDFAPGWELAIASEKAGIIGPESTAVLGRIPPELVAVFSAEGPAELVLSGVDVAVEDDQLALGGHMVDLRGRHATYTEVFVPLHGAHQLDNAWWRSPRSRRSSTASCRPSWCAKGWRRFVCPVASRPWDTTRSWCSTEHTTPTPSGWWRGRSRRSSPRSARAWWCSASWPAVTRTRRSPPSPTCVPTWCCAPRSRGSAASVHRCSPVPAPARV